MTFIEHEARSHKAFCHGWPVDDSKSIYKPSKRKHRYLGGRFSRKSCSWDNDGLNKESLAARASSNGTDPVMALAAQKKSTLVD